VVTARAYAAPADIHDLRASFERRMRAEHKSDKTILLYTKAVDALADYLASRGMPMAVSGIKREHVETFLADLQDRGWKPATCNQLYRSLAQFWKYLVDEDEIPFSPMAKVKAPRIPTEPARLVTREQVEAMLEAARGKTMRCKRDQALIALMYATGCRLSEIAGLRMGDLDMQRFLITVTGKGGHVRTTRFGARTATYVDRYLRERNRWIAAHDLRAVRRAVRDGRPWRAYVGEQALWMGEQGPMTKWGISAVINDRAEQAGLGRINPHALRHGYVHEASMNGASEHEVASELGWTSTAMMARYARATAVERAHRRYDGFAPLEDH
jgi:site-specific recombinase XerD